jgi:Leucine-rich repeat (LRR) protein
VAFKRSKKAIRADGGPAYALGEIQINLAALIDIKEGVVVGGGGGHWPYKLARGFNGYSLETVEYVGALTMELAKKIEGGMLLKVTVVAGTTEQAQAYVDLGEVGAAIAKAMETSNCRLQSLAFGGNSGYATAVLEGMQRASAWGSLQRLNLSDCQSLESVPDGIGKLVNLSHLDLSGCERLVSLPEGLGSCVKLEHLDLARCKNLRRLEGLEKCINLLHLDLAGVNQTSLPGWLEKCTNLQYLNLVGWDQLTTLPEVLSHCTAIQHFRLDICRDLKILPAWFGAYADLKELSLFNCSELGELPSALSECVNLQKLILNGCIRLTSLPAGLGELANLKDLLLTDCKSLAEPFPDLSHLLPALKVQTPRASAAAEAWDKHGLKTSDGYQVYLKDGPPADRTYVSLAGFTGATLPEWVCKRSNLARLDLMNCSELTSLSARLGELANLQVLDLYLCKSLAEPFPDLSHLLPALKVQTRYASTAAKAWETRGFTQK